MERDLTIADLAHITGYHPETLRVMARRGQLPGVYRIGRKWLMTQKASNKLRGIPNGHN